MATELHPQSQATKEVNTEGSYASSVNSLSKSVDPSVAANPEKPYVDPTATEKPASVKETPAPMEREVDPTGAVIEQVEYPSGWKLALISIALSLSVFVLALDNSIIATAIPAITNDFKAINDVGWYISVYLLCTCAFQLMFGKLYTFYSIKWTYLTALLIFEVGSTICAAAPNSIAFIIGRAIAGLGSAGIFSGAILIVTYTVALEKRPIYTGLIGGMYGIASVAGPLLGGVFTDSKKLTWRWCFWINLPLGAVTALFIILFFKSPKRTKTKTSSKQQINQMDIPGTIFFLPGVICILLALQWGGTQYAWNSWRIILLLVFGIVLLATFVILQIVRDEKTVTVAPRVFKNRNIWATAAFAAFSGGAFFTLLFYLPIWFQAVKGASAIKSGIMTLPFLLGMIIFSIVIGALVTITGYYTPFMYLAAVLMPIGAGLLSTLKPDSHHSKWIGYQVIFGFGMGAGFQQPLIAAQAVLPLADIPIGTAIMMFSQILGGSIIASVGQNIFTNQLLKNLLIYAPGFDPSVILKAGATEFRKDLSGALLDAIIYAYNVSITQTFYVSVACGALAGIPLIFVQWVSIKGKEIQAGGAA